MEWSWCNDDGEIGKTMIDGEMVDWDVLSDGEMMMERSDDEMINGEMI